MNTLPWHGCCFLTHPTWRTAGWRRGGVGQTRHATHLCSLQQGKGKTMTERELGRSSLKVSVVGLGCLGMSDFYDPKHLNDEESVRVIQRYIDAGGNFLDTADAYGVGRSEILVGKAIRGRRDEVVVATKFGHVRGTGGEFLGIRGVPQYVRECCNATGSRIHRVEPHSLARPR
jgi:hypothetical protein